MSTTPIVSVENISKAFQIYAKPSDLFKEAIFGGKRHDIFWALRDISFSIREKQRVGIIGPNGAGKSTLLQIITGNLQPTSGQLHVNGKISALLSLVPSWSLEDSGIENIRFNLLLQGCSPSRIPSITEEIVDFTELGPFIYQPVKTYSSGMGARLSFAIATATQPDILIIDEVLATGDAYFIGKAYKRMMEFCDRGRAMIFVSHATDAVRRMCDTVIWLQNGTIRLAGSAEVVLRQYEEDYRRSEDESLRSGHMASSASRRRGVALDDILEDDLLHFRIVPKSGNHFANTHYLRNAQIGKPYTTPVNIPLEFVDLTKPESVAGLDLLTSEWGRMYERHGSPCRVLTHMTGRRAGGQLVAKLPPLLAQPTAVELTCEILSEQGAETLEIQLLDIKKGCWETLQTASRDSLEGGWMRLTATGAVSALSADDFKQARETLVEQIKSPVEIIETFVIVNGKRETIIQENTPFSIMVRIGANKTVPIADVSIKLIRSDGVYVFWQSSGMSGNNLQDLNGEKTVAFHFDQNVFGAGIFLISSYVANGWNLQENYPYSEVYCRSIDGLKVEIIRKDPALDLGVVNTIARIEVR